VGPTKRGKGTKIMAIAAVTSLPLAVTVDSASPHATKLVEETLAGSFLDVLPARLIGDRAYDSDPLDRRLERDYIIELIRPTGRTAIRPKTGASCDDTSDVGVSNGCLSGCSGSGD
jgi:hypothetical protein